MLARRCLPTEASFVPNARGELQSVFLTQVAKKYLRGLNVQAFCKGFQKGRLRMERFARVGSRSVWGSPGGLWRESGLAFPRNPRFSRLRSLLQMPHPRTVAAPCRAKEPTQRLLLLLWHRQPCARVETL